MRNIDMTTGPWVGMSFIPLVDGMAIWFSRSGKPYKVTPPSGPSESIEDGTIHP